MALKQPTIKRPEAINQSRETKQGGKSSQIPLVGRLPIGKQLQLLGGGSVLFLLTMVVAAYMDNRSAANGTRYVVESSRLLMLSQRMAKAAERSLAGDQQAFDELSQSREATAAILTLLDKGGSGLPATSGNPRAALNELNAQANKTLADVVAIEEGRPGLVTVNRAIAAIDATGQELRNQVKQLVARSEGAIRERAVRFSLLVERIAKDASSMRQEISEARVNALAANVSEASETLASIPAGDPLVASIVTLFDGYRISAEAISGNAKNLLNAENAGKAIYEDSEQFLGLAQKLTDTYQASLTNSIASYVMAVSGVMVLIMMMLLAKAYREDSTRRTVEAEQSNRRNQEAILRLMNEMGDLADGDLTVKATVTEDVTGAIADSVNYTTDELRKLVSGITTMSEQVTKAAGAAEIISKNLLAAAQKQTGDIRDASEAVGLISKSIQEVDASAAQSLQVARRTLEMTEEGAQAVQNTIIGMDEIREQIQETSKRIKRLGESSQEIGEIVELISDITEQTNVLALNAAIQAASAGEAGRGFSVVAAEVQRLAERSAEATKQIASLVKTIQGDTQDTIAAMEKSTQGVVEGANLSNVAGQSLREIEEVSRELAGLINSISVSTQVQTDMAREVATTMVNILHVTEQATEGTKRTADSVVELASLATGLKASVSGFKL